MRLPAGAAVAVLVLAMVLPWPLRAASTAAARTSLTFATLEQGRGTGEVDLSAFAPPADAEPPSQVFEGNLRVSGKVRTRTVFLDEAFLAPAQAAAARTFPSDFDYAFVQDGDVLLPVRRGYIASRHPHWDIVLEPGRVWDEPGDRGFTRAALPFALVQKHMNCTHYGVMTFLFRGDGAISHVAMQMSSETCRYFKFDMWGMLDASYVPHPVAGRDAAVAAYRDNRSHRMPERPIARLAADHPGADPARLAIGEANARTLFGLAVGGVNYVSACPTRHGDYPYCDALPFPSYSTAKSAVAALAAMAVEARHPGVLEMPVTALAPSAACATPDWDGVTLRDLLDMTSGHYDSTAYMADEDATKAGTFFHATTERQKAAFACAAYPRRSPPGTRWVYHTSATFLLGDALNRYLRSLPGEAGADVFRDVVDAGIFSPLGLSATARTTRRTADTARQPFFGYGLQFNRDDIARLAVFIGHGDGRIAGRQVLEPRLLALALQQVAGQRGSVVTSYPDFRYQLGFWARDVADVAGCRSPTWVPFMSGFGGISVVMYPNGVVYYNVSDSGSAAAFDWGPSAPVARAIHDYCH